MNKRMESALTHKVTKPGSPNRSAAVPRDSIQASPLNPLAYDQTFATGGTLKIAPHGRQAHWATSIVQLRQGNYVAGFYEAITPGNPGDYTNFAGLIRFNSHGIIDTAFGDRGDGIAEIRFEQSNYSLTSDVFELGDGHLLVTGRQFQPSDPNSFLKPMMCRLKPDGALDTHFASKGVLDISQLVNIQVFNEETAILADGRIMIAATAATGPMRSYLIRLTPDGQLDLSFANGGIKQINRVRDIPTRIFGLKLLADNKKLITYGYYVGLGNKVGFIAQLDIDANFDLDFGSKGCVDIKPDQNIEVMDVFIDKKENTLLAAGWHDNPAQGIEESMLAKYTADGSSDKSFNNGEPVYLKFDSTSTRSYWNTASVLAETEGKILMSGSGGTLTHRWSAAALFNPAGELDTSFAGGAGIGSPDSASFFGAGHVGGSDPGVILCAGAADGVAAVLAIKV